MTVEEVRRRVEEIRTIRERDDDDEACHGREDALHQDVLRAIAAGTCALPAVCAEVALSTKDIPFARWCA